MSEAEIIQGIAEMRGDPPSWPDGRGGTTTFPPQWKASIGVCLKMLAEQDFLERVRPCAHGAGVRTRASKHYRVC